MRLVVAAIAVATLMAGCTARRELRLEPNLSIKQSTWYSYERYDFTFDGRPCIIVKPKQVARGAPWLWRAAFFGERPEVDLALLERGFHVAFMDVTDFCGSPSAVAHWNAFYEMLTREEGLAAKPALSAISRGGLIAYNWAAANPNSVACIYADIAVCDFKSWPGGKGKGDGDAGLWRGCLQAYGFSEEQAMAYRGNPIDNLAPLARARVPLLHAYGDADRVVPFDENTALVEQRYRELFGDITVIVKHGWGHGSGLDDPRPAIDFILAHTRRTWWQDWFGLPR